MIGPEAWGKKQGWIRCARWGLFLIAVLAPVVQSAETGDEMKRRQQGILTGMPFMTNLAPRTFVDAGGRKLFLAKAPSRVVSLAPSVTEILFAIDSGDRVIAVTELCDFPPEAGRKIRLKGTNPSVEQIVALQPDLVLAPKDFVSPDLLQQMDHLKVPIFLFSAASLEDIFSEIHTVARVFERQPTGDALVAGLRQRLMAVKDQVRAHPRPRVLYVLNTDPLQSVGPGSFIHQLIDLAGGLNVAAEAGTAYPRLSVEDVIMRDPEYLVFPAGADEGIPEEERQQWRRWPWLSAVRHNRLVSVPSVLVDRPGPRIVDGLEQLARAIHPELAHRVSHEKAP